MPTFDAVTYQINKHNSYDLKLVGMRVDVVHGEGRYRKALSTGHIFRDLHQSPNRSASWIIDNRFVWVNDEQYPAMFATCVRPYHGTRIYLYYIRSTRS